MGACESTRKFSWQFLRYFAGRSLQFCQRLSGCVRTNMSLGADVDRSTRRFGICRAGKIGSHGGGG